MRYAIVLDHHDPRFIQKLSEIDAFLSVSAIEGLHKSRAELWLFGEPESSLKLPRINTTIECVRYLPVCIPFVAENCIEVLAKAQASEPMDLVLFYADPDSSELATRLAYRSEGSSATAVHTLKIENDSCEVEKSCYHHNMMAGFSLEKRPFCISIIGQPTKPTACLEYQGEQKKFLDAPPNKDWLISIEETSRETGNELADHDLILAVGMGLGGVERLNEIKQKIDGTKIALGCSRPVAMNAWCELDKLIGISGQLIAPKVCIAAGVSGASAFTFGIKESQCIVAINNDPHAAIFTQADLAVIGDMHAILPELIRCIESAENNET